MNMTFLYLHSYRLSWRLSGTNHCE